MAVKWRDVLVVHPVAELFPLAKPEELQELKRSIAEVGLQDPIILGRRGDRWSDRLPA